MAGEVFSFNDHLEPAGDKPIRVLARIRVRRTEDGGRAKPFTKNFRPNHNFGAVDNRYFFIGQIEVPDGKWIYPGETHDLEITFLNVRGLIENLEVGRQWRIQEGGRYIAAGEVLSLLSEA
jgi:translation elongation factor EF-Tu-like GTPase